MELIRILAYFIFGSFLLIYLALKRNNSYFSKRGILHDKPELFYGNLKEFTRSKTLYQIIREYYMKYKGTGRFVGFYLYMRKAMVLLDLDLIQDICVKDFENFTDHGYYYNEKDDPISAHLVHLDGVRWKTMRAKLTPAFTTRKIKFMLTSVVDIANQLVSVLEETLSSTNMDDGVHCDDLMVRYTTDVTGSVAFGLKCNSLNDPNCEFVAITKKICYYRYSMPMVALMTLFPNLFRKLGFKIIIEEVSQFFLRVVRETVEFRDRTGEQRKDFLNILKELRKPNTVDNLTMDEITAQAFAFFLAGYETSASVLSFCLYELALNQDIQDKARREINEIIAQHDGKPTYEAVKEMKYLLQVMYETIRMYSVVPGLVRKTAEDYIVSNTNYVIEKGTTVIIPLDAIHYDPDIYPNPEQFDPERFTKTEVENRHPMAWLGFGRGGRACIGYRFAEVQVLIGLSLLLKNFRFSPTQKTQIPMKFNMYKLFRGPEKGVYLKVEKL
ncbi:probable cytochrome P450 6a18 [Teleopsis dalmanni]|uniref:probable cytochrome P450 6a18 n=1 Tax=Teleopsis dalmanni TaxID=139649 RepID=UPI0018CE21A7|nr:probable cytochrome P450 6a18 [Teleopsis dalmanni]